MVMTQAVQARTRNPRGWVAAIALGVILLGGCASQEESSEQDVTTESRETPSALDHTYHGEAVKARARAIRTLNNVDAQRKDLEQEERSFERPSAPVPRDNP